MKTTILDLIWNIKVLIKQRRCVRCGKLLFKEAEGVNVYDRVVGRGLGVKCYPKCNLVVGTPEWVKLYWIEHFLNVIYQPDWFAKYAYDEAWEHYIELAKTMLKLKERLLENPLPRYFKRKYPNNWDKKS